MRSLYIIQQTDHGLPSDAEKVKKYWESFKYDLTDFSVKGVWLLPKTARSEEPLPSLRTDCCSDRFKQVQNSIWFAEKVKKKLCAGVTAVTVYCLKYYKVYSRFYSASLLSKLQLVKLRILYCSTLLWLRVPEIVDFWDSHQVLQILLALLLFLLTPKIWSHTALQVKEPPWTPAIISWSHTTYLRNRQPLFNSRSWVFLTYKSLSNTSTWKLNIITSVPKLFQSSPVELSDINVIATNLSDTTRHISHSIFAGYIQKLHFLIGAPTYWWGWGGCVAGIGHWSVGPHILLIPPTPSPGDQASALCLEIFA